MVSVGVVSGQPLNKPEKNLSKHFVARVSYPFNIGSQTMELGFGGYTGLFQVKTDKDKDVAVMFSERPDMRDLPRACIGDSLPQALWSTSGVEHGARTRTCRQRCA